MDPDPDPGCFIIHDTKRIFSNFYFLFSNLYHISFDYEGISLKQMTKFE